MSHVTWHGKTCQIFLTVLSSEKNFMAPFHGWGSTASRLQPLWGGSLLFTARFLETPGTHFIDLKRMKSWVDLTATQWNWTRDPWIDWASSVLTTRPFLYTYDVTWCVLFCLKICKIIGDVRCDVSSYMCDVLIFLSKGIFWTKKHLELRITQIPKSGFSFSMASYCILLLVKL